MFRNTCKILMNNFSLTWKILLYKVIVFIGVMGLTTVVCLPIINTLAAQDFFGFLQTNVSNLLLNFNLNVLIETIFIIIQKFFEIINASGYLVFSICALSITIIVYYYISSLCELAVVDELNSFMSSNYKLGFVSRFVSNFRKSLNFGLIKLITVFIIDLIIILGAAALYYITAKVIYFIAPIIVILFLIIMFALRITIFACTKAAIVVNGVNPFKAFKMNLKAISKKFIQVFSNILVILALVLILNMFAMFFTFGATALITLPLSMLFIIIFENVVYYENNGMRYYCDNQTFVIPKKLEEQDSLKKVIDII